MTKVKTENKNCITIHQRGNALCLVKRRRTVNAKVLSYSYRIIILHYRHMAIGVSWTWVYPSILTLLILNITLSK